MLASIACSSGSDFTDGSLIPRNDVFNDPLPPSFDDQFKVVTGGSYKIGGTRNTNDTYIDFDGTTARISSIVTSNLAMYDDDPESGEESLANQELNDGENDEVTVDTFLMMKTEVTVGMFVDFLNSIAFKQDELTNAGEGETTTFTNPEIIYKPIMQNEASCGIYRFEFGVRVNEEISEFSGYSVNIEESNSQKPTSSGFIDPYIDIQKPRFASENQSSSFEVAPRRRDYPMPYVSQSEAKEFCRWLGAQYRLPTWQEWTWAAQGGTSEYQFPTSDGNLFFNGLKVANFQYNSGTTLTTREVGTTGPPNPFGLFDLGGNVYEWTYFKAEDQATGATIPYTTSKFIMGGGFKTQEPGFLSTWFRFGLFSDATWADDLGFRVIFDQTRGNSIADSR